MSRYLKPNRNVTVAARMTPRDREILERAADEAGVSLSSFLADRAVRAARLELPDLDSPSEVSERNLGQ